MPASSTASTARARPASSSPATAHHTGQLLRQLRARLGAKTPLIAGDGFLTIPDLIRLAGPAANGIYISVAGLPNENLPATGHHFLNAFTHTQENTHTTAYSAAYAAQATDALLAAIARSDGTRASVTRQLFKSTVRNGILGSFRFTHDGDMTPTPITIYRVVGGHRPNSTYERDFAGAVIDRVITTPTSLAH
jgi:branched-chain amino acid transport system substrate-binding protein